MMTRTGLALVGCTFLLFMPLVAGCSARFELTNTTSVCGDHSRLTSWQSQRLQDVQYRLARELTQRTGREWKVTTTLFRPSTAPANTIFFSKTNKTAGEAFAIHVTPKSVVVEANAIEGLDKAVDALLGALVQENGRFFLPAGTLKP